MTGKIIHIDFYQPDLKEKVQVSIPLVFIGEAPAAKELSGTFVKNISEIEIKALPQDLPHEIRVDISGLKSFQDRILIKNLNLPKNVDILRSPDDIVAQVVPPAKTEELEKPIEEKVEEVEMVEKKRIEESEQVE